MPYVYNADLYCDSCGRAICAELTTAGHAPEDPEDEYSFDSDEFPKYVGDPGKSDGPNHCGARGECLEPVDLEPYGARADALKGAESVKIGALIGGELTADGVEYLREMIAADNSTPYQSALHAYWREVFADYL